MNKQYDYIIVGAGFAGASLANILAKENKKILIIEKRNHIGGNSYDCYDKNNVLIHLYGPHIFHTYYEEVFEFLKQFGEFEKYEHKVYLSGLIKLGISRDKIGDILVQDNGADIIVSVDIANFICYNLGELIRFSKSKIEIIGLKDIREKVQEYKDITIRVTSLRLDAIVAELANTSRSKALEIINSERVFVNYKQELKNTRNIQIKDIITIRGVGKFIVFESLGSSRSGKIMLHIKMYM